jgi:hypothetical protein
MKGPRHETERSSHTQIRATIFFNFIFVVTFKNVWQVGHQRTVNEPASSFMATSYPEEGGRVAFKSAEGGLFCR